MRDWGVSLVTFSSIFSFALEGVVEKDLKVKVMNETQEIIRHVRSFKKREEFIKTKWTHLIVCLVSEQLSV